MATNLFGVKIDYVTIEQASEIVNKWLQKKGKHKIVTPNPEMLVDSKFDPEFKRALNEADLAISDSPRLGWASWILQIKNPITRFIYFPTIFLPNFFYGNKFTTTTGTDLTEKLIKLSEEKAYTTAYLGGSKEVAVRLYKCLRRKYPKLKIVFCSGDIIVDKEGRSSFDTKEDKMTMSKVIKPSRLQFQELNAHTLTQKVDILFVAFGHIKQEKWMNKNLHKLNSRVMVGVGGAFDYLSGRIPRAPKILRSLGIEWFYRLIHQPWRIKRFWKLPYFLYMVMSSK